MQPTENAAQEILMATLYAFTKGGRLGENSGVPQMSDSPIMLRVRVRAWDMVVYIYTLPLWSKFVVLGQKKGRVQLIFHH